MALEREHWNETDGMEQDVVVALSSCVLELVIFEVQSDESGLQEAAGPPQLVWVGGVCSCEQLLCLSAVMVEVL